jgi:methyl-accepting chemotaxis protein
MWKINFNFMTKVTLMAVMLIVLTASTMGIATFTQSRSILVRNQLQELGSHAEVNSVRLVAGIDALRHDVVFVSKLPAVDGIRRAIENGGVDPVDLTTDALWRTQLMAIFGEMLESKPHYVQMQYIAADGLELVHVERAGDAIRAFGRRELGFDIADDFFGEAQAIANDEVYLSDIRLRRSHDELVEPRTIMMYGSTPIYGDDGRVFGVIAIGMDFGTVFDEMLAFKEDTETLYVTNQAGELLLNSADLVQTFGFEVGDSYRIQESFAYLAPLFVAGNTVRELPASPDTSQEQSALHYLQVPFDPLNPARYLGVAVAKPYSEIVGEIDSFVNQGVVLTVFLVVCGIALAIIIARILIRPLYNITAATQQFSEGRFDVYLPNKSGDEFGQLSRAFNLMSERIRTMIDEERRARQTVEDTNEKIAERILVEQQQRTFLEQLFAQIADVINTLHSVSAELQSAATQQSASANEQAATVTQAVTTVEETHTTVQQTAERAQNVTDASQESVKVSRAGREAVNNSIQGMEVIRHQVADIAENILMLAERTQQIGEIIDTVNALAEQSKLLALNASIEAARAGEEGRGFAVVAMEVRQLAEQSREATQRVRDILGEIQQATNSAVMVTEEGTKAAARGASLVEQAGKTIEELAQTLELAAQSSTQIAASTRQQSSGMEQLMAAMQQIRQASMQNASTSQQIEESTRHLLDIANQLQVAVESHEV